MSSIACVENVRLTTALVPATNIRIAVIYTRVLELSVVLLKVCCAVLSLSMKTANSPYESSRCQTL